MNSVSEIPSRYWIAAKELNKNGFSYSELKLAAHGGGGTGSPGISEDKAYLLSQQEF